jgi:hypothetical protein
MFHPEVINPAQYWDWKKYRWLLSAEQSHQAAIRPAHLPVRFLLGRDLERTSLTMPSFRPILLTRV